MATIPLLADRLAIAFTADTTLYTADMTQILQTVSDHLVIVDAVVTTAVPVDAAVTTATAADTGSG